MKELHLIKLKTVILLKPIALLFFSFFITYSYAAITPSSPQHTIDFRKIKVKDVEKLAGKKLSFFQKIKLKILLAAAKKLSREEITEKQEKQATASMLLGLGIIVLMLLSALPFVGFISILCFPAAILAIIFGMKSLKGNSNTKGIIGLVSGGLVLLLAIVAIIIIAAAFASLGVE